MGASAYFYMVPFAGDAKAALDALREREFRAGRYNPVMDRIRFPITDKSPSPGAKHPTIENAMEAAREEGTRSILDILEIVDEPAHFGAFRLPDETLTEIYGTDQPDRTTIGNDRYLMKLFSGYRIERGQAIYFLIYDQGKPTEILFAGYSFD